MSMPAAGVFREALSECPQLGLCIAYPAPGIIERIGPDWDWVWVDGQHGQLDYQDILAAVRACNFVRRPVVVRAAGGDSGTLGRILDTAPDGIMVPMVHDAEYAQKAVEATRFPPLGARYYVGRRPVDLFGRDYAHPDRPQPLLICQIESPLGVTNAAGIAAVEGVDALFFGPDDMALHAGLPMNVPLAEGCFDDALRHVAEAAESCGKIAGGLFATNTRLRSAVDLGYRLIAGGADAALLAVASRDTTRSLRQSLRQKTQPLDREAARKAAF